VRHRASATGETIDREREGILIMPWKRDVIRVDSSGRRCVSDVYSPCPNEGGGCGQVVFKRQLAAGERWPPAPQAPGVDPEVARRHADVRRQVQEIATFLTSGESSMDVDERKRWVGNLEQALGKG
jgi:hypothetical protein